MSVLQDSEKNPEFDYPGIDVRVADDGRLLIEPLADHLCCCSGLTLFYYDFDKVLTYAWDRGGDFTASWKGSSMNSFTASIVRTGDQVDLEVTQSIDKRYDLIEDALVSLSCEDGVYGKAESYLEARGILDMRGFMEFALDRLEKENLLNSEFTARESISSPTGLDQVLKVIDNLELKADLLSSNGFGDLIARVKELMEVYKSLNVQQ